MTDADEVALCVACRLAMQPLSDLALEAGRHNWKPGSLARSPLDERFENDVMDGNLD